ncbi:MAG TPA: glycosyltransferase family 2 protein [Sphingomicrobium sp.]|nr:glycosyltransferase family 2 protein [Sphingomicrobium sp.]
MARTFAIITTCKGRLEHLKVSLPKMLAQRADEVIVVDYSCPEGAGEFVASNFPSVRVVSVPDQEHFSNWKARNAGAAVASSDVLVFVDADTILADGAIDRLSTDLPLRTYGFFDSKTSRAFNDGGPRLASNQLKGFHVIPSAAFRRAGGYDEVVEGYAAGADTDLEERLQIIGLGRNALDGALVESVIQHDAASRTEHHAYPVRTSYAAGLLYRAAKRALLRARGSVELPLKLRRQLYAVAKDAAKALGSRSDSVGMTVVLGKDPILMPRQLGYERGVQTLSLRVEVSLEGKLAEIPD